MAQRTIGCIDGRQFVALQRSLFIVVSEWQTDAAAEDARPPRYPMLPIQSTVATRYSSFVTWGLISANCVVFLYERSLDTATLQGFLFRYALIPARDLAGENGYRTFATNMFLHGGWLHLIGNMWVLWLFGPAVEDRVGHARYFSFYLGCGLVASAVHAFMNSQSHVPALGASGAIAGILGCYMRFFPAARVVVLVPLIFIPLFFQMPAAIFAGLWFLMQFIQGSAEVLAPTNAGGVAWWAHVGGFVVGFVVAPLLRKPTGRTRDYYPDEGVLGFDPSGRP